MYGTVDSNRKHLQQYQLYSFMKYKLPIHPYIILTFYNFIESHLNHITMTTPFSPLSKNTITQSQNSNKAQNQSKNSSAKKKPFARKPATPHSSQRKRKSIDDFIENSLADTNQIETNPFFVNPPAKMNFVKRKERQTEFYNKQKQEVNSQKEKDTSVNGYSSKKNLPYHIPYPSRKNQSQTLSQMSNSLTQSYSKFTHISLIPAPNSSRVAYQKQQSKHNLQEKQQHLLTRQKKNDPNLPVSSNIASSYSKYARLNTLNQNTKNDKGRGDNLAVVQCIYCKNNKEMTDIMCQKYSKLQDQLKAKNQRIKDITSKYESLKQEHSKLTQKYEHKLQASQLKQIQFFREKEDLLNRIDSFKNDMTRLNQKIKYSEIQNSVLLRYKDQYQLMIKEYDLIAYENEKLQKSLAHSKKQVFSKKGKPSLKEDKQKIVSNTNYSKKSSTEDDLMSLSLSQQSIDYF